VNEDSFTIQLRLRDQSFASFDKQAIAEETVEKASLMPPYKLNNKDLQTCLLISAAWPVPRKAACGTKKKDDENYQRLFFSVVVLTCRLYGADVTFDRLIHAAQNPSEWLTYWGDYRATRFRNLNQINDTNVKSLHLEWMFRPMLLAHSKRCHWLSMA